MRPGRAPAAGRREADLEARAQRALAPHVAAVARCGLSTVSLGARLAWRARGRWRASSLLPRRATRRARPVSPPAARTRTVTRTSCRRRLGLQAQAWALARALRSSRGVRCPRRGARPGLAPPSAPGLLGGDERVRRLVGVAAEEVRGARDERDPCGRRPTWRALPGVLDVPVDLAAVIARADPLDLHRVEVDHIQTRHCGQPGRRRNEPGGGQREPLRGDERDPPAVGRDRHRLDRVVTPLGSPGSARSFRPCA